MEKYLHNEKLMKVTRLIVVTLVVVGAIKYLLPLIWPFALAYPIGVLTYKMAEFLNRNLQFKKNIATVLSIVVLITICGLTVFFLGKNLLVQIQKLIVSWPQFQSDAEYEVEMICKRLDDVFRLSDGELYNKACDVFNDTMTNAKNSAVSIVMKNSKNIVLIVGEMFAALVVAVMGGYFFARDHERIKEYFDRFIFKEEYAMITAKLGHVFKAFVRAQLIIMSITSVICTIGLVIIQNPYSLLLGMVIGLLDALPFIGTGLVLVPWSIAYFLMGNVRKGVVILVVYVICYLSREILEPKIMGGNMGMNPLISLISIYVGYKVFGLLGVILGPIAFVMISELSKMENY